MPTTRNDAAVWRRGSLFVANQVRVFLLKSKRDDVLGKFQGSADRGEVGRNRDGGLRALAFPLCPDVWAEWRQSRAPGGENRARSKVEIGMKRTRAPLDFESLETNTRNTRCFPTPRSPEISRIKELLNARPADVKGAIGG